MTNPSNDVEAGRSPAGEAGIPTQRQDITPGWLSAFLSARRPGVVVEGVEVLDATQGAATRLRLGLRYAPGADGGLPPVLFLKAALTRRMLVTDPHMYVTEVRFYQSMRDRCGVEAPAVFGAVVDEATGRHALAIEDLALRGATFPSAQSDVTPDDVAAILTTVARFHAAHWGAADLAVRYPWLETATTGKSAEWWRRQARAVADSEVASAPYKAEAVAGLALDAVFAAHAALQERNDRGTRTVVHGDVHIGNTYLLPDGSGGLLDWQLMMACGWACDVNYLAVTALDPATRRAAERDLLRHYLDALAAAGASPPGWDEAWEAYRAQSVWGVVSWLVTPTVMYDEARLRTLLDRCVAAVGDHQSLRLLGASRRG